MTRTPKGMTREFRNCCRNPFACGLMALVISCLSLPMVEATEYYVAVDHPNASDTNNGLSIDQPYKTLGQAVRALSPGDTLSIKEGVYREPLLLGIDGTPSSPVVARAYPGDEGKVVIRGSDVVTGWTNDGGTVWSVPWQTLPLLDYPDGWVDYGEYSQRREMVFIDGKPLKQVLSGAELASGHFWMDDAAQRIRINYSGDPNSSQVEISVRTQGVAARGRIYQVIRGLRVEHVTTELFIAAMSLGSYQRVEDCRVEYNNGVGIGASSDSVIIRTTSNHNGRLGIGLSGHNSLFDSSETSYNSWRYGPGFAAGGIKIVDDVMGSGNRIVRHTAKYNNGPGIAFDSVGSGNIVEASLFEGNRRAALVIESMAGPNLVINNIIVGTRKALVDHPLDGVGILIDCSLDTYIYNNTIVGVTGSGIAFKGGTRGDGVYYPANTRVFNNIIVDPGLSAIQFKVWGVGALDENVESHKFDNNLYFGAEPTIIYKGSENVWSLAEFQENTGEDLNSMYEDPEFVRPSVADFSLLTHSPAIDTGSFLVDVPEDTTGRPRPQDVRHDIGAYECPQSGGCGSIAAIDFENGYLWN